MVKKSGHPLYGIWQQIKARCLFNKCPAYPSYGGRGITLCQEWLNFERFAEDMGARPSAKHSIDRIDNNGPYTKENCRWATQKEQCRNTRRNNVITIDGQAKTKAEWCEIYGIKEPTVYQRYKRGVRGVALFAPVGSIIKPNTRMVSIAGVSRPLCEWAKISGIQAQTIAHRIKTGVSEEALLQASRVNNRGRPLTVNLKTSGMGLTFSYADPSTLEL